MIRQSKNIFSAYNKSKNMTQESSVMKMSEITAGTYNVTHIKEIDTPYGKSFVLVLDNDTAVFANAKLKRMIKTTGNTTGVTLEHRGMKSFIRKKDNMLINYADVVLSEGDVHILIQN